MCNNVMHAAGYAASDMHGFITVVPADFRLLQSQGYAYINPIPLSPRDVRCLEHPEKR